MTYYYLYLFICVNDSLNLIKFLFYLVNESKVYHQRYYKTSR